MQKNNHLKRICKQAFFILLEPVISRASFFSRKDARQSFAKRELPSRGWETGGGCHAEPNEE
jgi:hypothetical protein